MIWCFAFAFALLFFRLLYFIFGVIIEVYLRLRACLQIYQYRFVYRVSSFFGAFGFFFFCNILVSFPFVSFSLIMIVFVVLVVVVVLFGTELT